MKTFSLKFLKISVVIVKKEVQNIAENFNDSKKLKFSKYLEREKIDMKNNVFYKLTGSFDLVVSGTNKKFKTATDAINYALKLFPNSQVQEEIIKPNNSIEYVISQTKRFTVTELSL